MISGAYVLNLIRIRTGHSPFIMFDFISGKSKACSEIDAHLAPPVESVAYGRRDVYAGPFGDIGPESQISKWSEFAEFQVYPPLNKDRSDPVVKFPAPLHSETGSDEKHRINLIAVRG